MAHKDHHMEPNVRFTPDKKMVIFSSNMFGPNYVFGVEVAKATNFKPSKVYSTPEFATQFTPANPIQTHSQVPTN